MQLIFSLDSQANVLPGLTNRFLGDLRLIRFTASLPSQFSPCFAFAGLYTIVLEINIKSRPIRRFWFCTYIIIVLDFDLTGLYN